MSWLAKINLNTVVQKLGAFRSAILLLALIATCLFCGYRLGNFFSGYQKQTIQSQKARLNKLYAQQVDLVKRIHTLEVELEVERMASQRMQQLLTDTEREHFNVKKELAFYEKVMAPEKQVDGVVVDSFTIEPTGSLNHYRFQIVLVQQQVKKRFAKGSLEVRFKGNQNQQPVSYLLTDISDLTDKSLAFSFKYFQIFEGEFTLPEGFNAEQVELATILNKTSWQAYQKVNVSHQWASLLQNSPQSSALILD
ncbi:DUF6776 family protein [Thalassotalea ganghwensis]